MPVVNVELNARADTVRQPVIWRLARLFNVVTNVRRARVTEDYGYVLLEMEGSTQELEEAKSYLAGLGMVQGAHGAAPTVEPPEDRIPQPNSIYVRLTTVNPEQGQAP